MLYGIRWYDKYHHRYVVTTGGSIPDALQRGQMQHGINFLVSEKLYGIMDINGDFARVPELDEPGLYKETEMEKILRKYYNREDK